MHARAIAILGATGSIGTTTLSVVRAHPSRLRIAGLAAHSRWRELVGPAKDFGVGVVAWDRAAGARAGLAGEERVNTVQTLAALIAAMLLVYKIATYAIGVIGGFLSFMSLEVQYVAVLVFPA